MRLLTLLTRILVVHTKAQQEPMRSTAQVHKGANEERSPSTHKFSPDYQAIAFIMM